MCSFIGLIINKDIGAPLESTISTPLNEEEATIVYKTIIENLCDKGGDEAKILFINYNHVEQIELKNLKSINFQSSEYEKILRRLKDCYTKTAIFAFSRQIPETEKQVGENLPPYKTIFGDLVAGHGTIPLKDFDLNIIDTEILRFNRSVEESLSKVEDLNGKISILQYNLENNSFYGIHNGLGLSYISKSGLFTGLTTTIFDDTRKRSNICYEDIPPNKAIYLTSDLNVVQDTLDDEEIVVSLCSGGMDALLSTTSYLIDNHFSYSLPTNKIEKIDIVYFDWDTRAKNQEIEAVNNFGKYLNDLNIERFESSNEVPIDIEIIEAKNYFKNILGFARIEDPRLCSVEAVGLGTSEAEEAISYVPLRNTYLLLALVTKYEALYPNKKVTFIFGGNLTEGMVYSDNSVNYIDKMNNLIKVAGQKTSNFSLVSPFSKMTKTNMLEFYKNQYGFENLEKLLNISFSCYFPIDNKPCGKCGSCLLREKSISRSISKYSSGNELNKLVEKDIIKDR